MKFDSIKELVSGQNGSRQISKKITAQMIDNTNASKATLIALKKIQEKRANLKNHYDKITHREIATSAIRDKHNLDLDKYNPYIKDFNNFSKDLFELENIFIDRKKILNEQKNERMNWARRDLRVGESCKFIKLERHEDELT